MVLRHAKWARRLLKKKDSKKSKKQQELERRRRRRRRLIVIGIAVLLIAMTITPGGIGAPSTTDGGGTTYGTVTGIPYADIFNEVAELGIDLRLVAAVAWAESGFDQDVIECRRASRAGALGIMQFMPGTAAGRGIDPCNPAEAIPAAACDLLELSAMFQDWELTLAGYNAGPYGDVAGCRCVPQNGETNIYVPKVMGKWREYQEQFPSGDLAEGGVPAGDCPVDAPQGGTTPVNFANTTKATLHMANEIVKCFGRDRGIGCYDPRGGNGAKYEHPRGRACDMMVTGGGQPSAEQKARGQAMAEWLMVNAGNFKVLYIIWHKRVWNPC